MQVNNKTNAFTLAEVLITLGVIGIVAAMTLPSLVKNYQHKALETAFKKAYSRHSQALMLVKADYGINNFDEFTVYDKNIKSYYRRNEFKDAYTSKLKVIGICKYKKKIRNYNNTADAYIDIGGTTNFGTLLSDGTCMGINVSAGILGITIDINGSSKGPNRLGHDVFTFHADKNGNWKPVKMSSLKNESDLENMKNNYLAGNGTGKLTAPQSAMIEQIGSPCSVNSKQKGNGLGCAWYALNDVSPDNSSAKYWENLPK